MIELITAGESHGKGLFGILRGIPCGLKIDTDFVNGMLALRQRGFGRGERMKIEKDRINIVSGIDENGVSTGSPIGFFIDNIDTKLNATKRSFTVPRPGHADFAGSVKYNFKNLAMPSERTSGRLSALDVAAGSIAALFLREFGVKVHFAVECIGKTCAFAKDLSEDTFKKALSSDILAMGKEAEMKAEIENAVKSEDTIGGRGLAIVRNLPAGLGDYNDWRSRADGLVAQAVMSVGTVKSVSIGESGITSGAIYHDPFEMKNGTLKRLSNNAGGIEGGITNGEDVVVRFFSKPIPTVRKGITSVDIKNGENTRSVYVRSDTCVVPAVTLVSAMRIALVFASLFTEKFGGDTMSDIRASFNNYVNSRRAFWQK